MRLRGLRAASFLCIAATALAGLSHGPAAFAEDIPPVTEPVDTQASPAGGEHILQLEVFINGASRDLIGEFRQEADGSLTIAPDELRAVGIEPVKQAVRPDGLIDVARLPGVSFAYDEANQAIHFQAGFESLSTNRIEAHGRRAEQDAPRAESSIGGLVNYTLFASAGKDDSSDTPAFEGASGWFEGRAFSPLGVVAASYIVRNAPNQLYNSVRIDTNWSYSSPSTMVTYRAGDVVSGGLSWTRPVRLGGIQAQRNFRLRSDLVTMPLPVLSGSAAVPSTVDVYVNNARQVSQQVPAGPFQISNLPVITGSGTARIVVRDALGRETVSETPFYASSNLLAPGLWDFSAESGFARRFYGVESNNYDGKLMASGTLRYGMSDRLTLEGHAEGGGGLINGGVGAVFGLSSWGIGSLAGAASSYDGQIGYQLAASVEARFRKVNFFARTQRTFGDYTDIAAVTAITDPAIVPDFQFLSAAPPRALDQVALSFPLSFDPSTFSLSYARIDTGKGDRSQIASLSFSRTFGKASLYATAFKDFDNRNSFGIFAGLSMPLGGGVYGSTGVSSDSDGITVTTDLVKSGNGTIGSYGWRLRDAEGAHTNRGASASYKTSFARFEGGVDQYDKYFRGSAQMDGAVVFAGGGVFLSNRINDAFAVVETGAPGVEVLYENRPAGRTNGRGRLLIPDMRSYEPNRITINPANLPVDAIVDSTSAVSVPVDRSGAVVKFGVRTSTDSALVTLRDENGEFLAVGAVGRLETGSQDFIVGYDGQAYITGLGSTNRVVVDLPDNGSCAAEFGFESRRGEQVAISNVVCHPIQ